MKSEATTVLEKMEKSAEESELTWHHKDNLGDANWLRRSSEEQVWTNNGCVFKLEEEVMLWLKLTPTCLAYNEYWTSREMY